MAIKRFVVEMDECLVDVLKISGQIRVMETDMSGAEVGLRQEIANRVRKGVFEGPNWEVEIQREWKNKSYQGEWRAIAQMIEDGKNEGFGSEGQEPQQFYLHIHS